MNSKPLKELLSRLTEAQKKIVEYWKRSPTNKLILINTGVYVKYTIILVHVEVQNHTRIVHGQTFLMLKIQYSIRPITYSCYLCCLTHGYLQLKYP